jgi:hypothetical protein
LKYYCVYSFTSFLFLHSINRNFQLKKEKNEEEDEEDEEDENPLYVELKMYETRYKSLSEKKAKIASLCSSILEDPQTHVLLSLSPPLPNYKLFKFHNE